MQQDCKFCNIDREIILENELALAFYDAYPVSKGHTLVIPRRHVEDVFFCSKDEIVALWELILDAKKLLDTKFKPDGYNIGTNIGRCAGQTIFHSHIHIIPRYVGDSKDPRGGIRRVKKALVRY